MFNITGRVILVILLSACGIAPVHRMEASTCSLIGRKNEVSNKKVKDGWVRSILGSLCAGQETPDVLE